MRKILASTVLMALAVASLSAASAAIASASNARESSECLEFDETGYQVWVGEPGDELTVLAEEVNELASEYRAITTGVAFCSRYDGVVLFVAGDIESAKFNDFRKRLAGISASHPGYPVLLNSVAESVEVLQPLATEVVVKLSGEGVVRAAPDVYSGGLRISLDVNRLKNADDVLGFVQQIVRAYTDVSIPLFFDMVDSADIVATRAVDSPPFWMGAALYDLASRCSAGVPIVWPGSGSHLLTAGHCQANSFMNNGYVVGNTHTTAYPGNAAVFGDWKLLKGNAYGLRVFNGDLSSNSSLPISGGHWGSMVIGQSVCTSGSTTAQVCRFNVREVNATALDSNGVINGHAVRMWHDGNLDGIPDLNGFDKGDSGGPCYYSDGVGGVKVAGIVSRMSVIKGYSGVSYRDYDCTQLSGVRAWRSTVNIG